MSNILVKGWSGRVQSKVGPNVECWELFKSWSSPAARIHYRSLALIYALTLPCCTTLLLLLSGPSLGGHYSVEVVVVVTTAQCSVALLVGREGGEGP